MGDTSPRPIRMSPLSQIALKAQDVPAPLNVARNWLPDDDKRSGATIWTYEVLGDRLIWPDGRPMENYMLERPRRVVLLIDYDNLQICAARDTPGRDLQLPPVMQLAQRYGTVIMARAYAEWNLSTERLAVYKAGIEPAFAPVLRTESDRSGKSLADTVMVAEGMDMLWTLSPEVVVLATSDKDLIPLVRVAKQRGAFVVVLGSDFTAIPLREMADEHVTYKQLITDSQGRYVTEAGPASRQPAALTETARRRPIRERNGRERTVAAAP